MIEEQAIQLLFNYGAMGVMLIWFMFRTEKIIKTNTDVMIEIKTLIKEKLR